MRMLIPLAALPLAAALVPLPAPDADAAAVAAVAPDTVVITEWTVPWERSRPRDPFVDPKTGEIWFVGQVGNYVARLNPKTGQFRRFELEERALPHNVVVAPDGMVWYAGNGNGHIGKLDPATGRVTRYPMPDTTARDPHTLTFSRSGDVLWFTVQGGAQIGRLDPRTGRVRLVKAGEPGRGSTRPYGIELDDQGRPWVNLFGTNKLAMVDPEFMTLRTFDLPDERARGRRIAVTDDDMVWYVDYARGFLSRFDPATGKVTEHALPSGADSRPYAMTSDDQGRLWTVETGVHPNRLVGFDPKTNAFFSITPIKSLTPDGRNTVRHMVYDQATRSIWFGTDANTIGRAVVR
jgi:virginiamycin B lyase